MEIERERIVFKVCMVHSYKSFQLKLLYTLFKTFIMYTVNSAEYNKWESLDRYAFLRVIIFHKVGKFLKQLWCCVGGSVTW